MAEIDPIDFRRAASHFPTGVTVVTTIDGDGQPAGLTVNSFTTVSLDPPLVLFCLGKESEAFEAFSSRRGFAVNVLAADQQQLSVRFAASGIDKFEGHDWKPGHNGLPILAQVLASFECDLYSEHDGGDHLILVGLVRRLDYAGLEREALGYFRGGYITVATPD